MLQFDESAIAKVRTKAPDGWRPKVLVVLGTGLGGLVNHLDPGAVEVSYSDIWPWAEGALEGHAKKLYLGYINGVPVLIAAGRFHLYEGYKAKQTVQIVLLAKALGVESVVLTNAAGCIKKKWKVGDLMVITDQINLTGKNPLKGKNNPELGPRFPSMTNVYALKWLMRRAGKEAKIKTRKGTYAALAGPDYETPATIRYLRKIGVDAIGMSTVLEAMVAVYLGLKVAGVTLLTNMAAGITGEELSHDEVQETGRQSAERFERLIVTYIGLLGYLEQVASAA